MVMAGALSVGATFAQDATPAKPEASPGSAWENCRMHRMERHRAMMEKMKAQDAEIEKLVADMNAAPADKKGEAAAAVLNKMFEQRKAWHGEMEARFQKKMEWKKQQMEGEKSDKS